MTKPQLVNQSVVIGELRDWRNGISGNPVTSHQYCTLIQRSGAQIINLKWPRSKDGKYRQGGPWLMWKEEVHWFPSVHLDVYRLSNKIAYSGRFIPNFVSYAGPSGWNSTSTLNSLKSSLLSRGAEAWNRMRPEEPDFTFASSVYELREPLPIMQNGLLSIMRKVDQRRARKGRPPLPGERRRRRRRKRNPLSRAGEFYLALQFGYLPLLRDIRNYVDAQRGAQKRLTQLIRDAGRPVRRRASLSKERTDAVSSSTIGVGIDANQNPLLVTQCYSGGDSWVNIDRETTTNTWCEGRFRYFLPPGPRDVAWNRKMYRRIMGWRITPRELYEVMPWSWLIDYFTDLGQFINAISPGVADRLVADYAFLMCTITYTVKRQHGQRVRCNSAGNDVRTALSGVTSIRTIKMRVKASPFGFGFSKENLTGAQAAILGALGLSRLD